MGDLNQRLYVEARAARFAPPYLEVGSRGYGRDYGSGQDLRGLFAERGEWLGVDLQPGPGVDIVQDLAAPWDVVDAALAGRRFGTVFCLSVLEHCRRPFAWKFHGYPSDYWRFTHEGVKQLFPGVAFADADTVLASERDRHTLPVDADMGRIPFSFGSWRRRGHPLRGLAAGGLRQLARLGLLRWLAGTRYVLVPSHLLMTGKLRGG
jgi:hypothetical protein